MKTLGQNFTELKDRRSSAPYILAVFHFAEGDVCVSDRTVTPPGGPEFKGLVTSWGRLSGGRGGLFDISIPEIALELADGGAPPFSSHLEGSAGRETEAELFLWFRGLGYHEKEPVGRFVMASPVTYQDGRVRLSLVGALISKNLVVGKTITRDAYPGADPDAIGEVENIVYGAPKNVVCRPVVAGAASRIVADISDTQTAGIELSMAADEVAFPAAGTLQVDAEKIGYTGISGRMLTGVSRGADGSIPARHKKGAVAFEVRSDFTYLVAGHPVKAIGDVYVGGVRAVSGVTRLTDDGGRAKVVFAGKFTLEKAVSLAVSEGSHAHSFESWSGQGAKNTSYPNRWAASVNPNWGINEHQGRAFRDSAGYYFFITGNGGDYIDVISVEGRVLSSGAYEGKIVRTQMQAVFQDTLSAQFDAPAMGSSSALCDGNFNGFCTVAVSDGYVDTKRSLALADLGTIVGARVCSMRGNSTYSGTGRSTVLGGIFNGQYSEGGGAAAQACKTDLQRGQAGPVAWADFEGMTIRATYSSGPAAACSEQWVEVYYVPYGPGASPATGVALSGNSAADMVVGGKVTCDVEGWADDLSGGATGMPDALIQNPADVMRHFLANYMGLGPDEVGPSFTHARDALSQAVAGGYRFAGVVDRPSDALDLLEEWSAQARVKFSHDGYTAGLSFVLNAPPSVDKTIGEGRIKKASLLVARTGKDELINRLDVRYLRDFSKGRNSFMAVAGASAAYPADGDPASVAAYGPMRPRRPFNFGFISDAPAALDLRDFYITRFKDVKRRVSFTAFLDNFELEEGDVISLDCPSAAPGLAGARFMVEAVALLPGSAAKARPDELQVRAVEV